MTISKELAAEIAYRNAQRVRIIRKRRSIGFNVGVLLFKAVGMLVVAWLIMLLVPAVGVPLAPGYWPTLGALVILRLALPRGGGGHLWWTEEK